jgi:hypothetical protein
MYIYTGEREGLRLFAVEGNERFHILNLYEKGIVESKHIEYNWKFTKVTVALRNPHVLHFEEGNEYGLVIEKGGIACSWDNKAPRYTKCIPTPPTKDTILELGLDLNPYDRYWHEFDSEYSIPSPKQKKKEKKFSVIISKYGEYKKINMKINMR